MPLPEENEKRRQDFLVQLKQYQSNQGAAPAPVEPAPAEQAVAPAYTPPTTITTERMPNTPGLQDLQKKQADVAQRQAQALEAISGAQQQGAKEQQGILADLDKNVSELETMRSQVEQQFVQNMQQEMGQIQARRAELEKVEPKTFWQKADTQDKLVMAVALLAGGIGQGLSGARTNAAIDAMNRAIDLDLAQQNKLIDRQLAALDQRQMDLGQKTAMQNRLLAEMDARKGAALSHARNLIERATLSTQNAEAKATLQQKLAELDQSMLANDQQLQERLAGRVTTQMEVGGTPPAAPGQEQRFEDLPKDTQSAVKILGDKTAGVVAIRNEIASALKDLQDPKLSRDDKLRIGTGLVKTLNSTQGSDAVGAEEAKRLASELEGNAGIVAKLATAGAGAGATAGGAIAGAFTAGVGAPVGAIVGGTLGLIGGAVSGVIDAMGDPGGLRFRPDVEGFTKRVELTLKKIDSTVQRNTLTAKFMKAGADPVKASEKAEETLRKMLEAKRSKK